MGESLGHRTRCSKTLIDRKCKTQGDSSPLENAIVEIIDSSTNGCKFKKPKPRPIALLPIASSFNETIAMDSKSYNGVYFLALVDPISKALAS